jgi:hypothetical protein
MLFGRAFSWRMPAIQLCRTRSMSAASKRGRSAVSANSAS